MQFAANTIDLIKTHEAFASKFRPARISRQRFGTPTITMAHSTIGRYGVPIEDLPGIRKCLLHTTGQVYWRNHLWLLPLPSKTVPFGRGPFGGHWESEKLALLVDSLILTILVYQQPLWEFETNLAQILMIDLVSGFELLCDWIARGVPIDATRNDLILPIEASKVDGRLTVINPN